MKAWRGAALGVLATLLAGVVPASAQTWLRADGTRIVDGDGQPVILRGMGLGGWMLQEGYMLGLGDLGKGQQHVIRAHIADLVGEAKADEFYNAWLDNFVTKADVDWMAAQGFNSIRLPMHYNLLTLPVTQEPVAGEDSWLEGGFERIDRLLDWTRANGMYLILDLHAAPGGQGNDLPIADRDPAKPSLWEDPENRRETVALWKKLAERYADQPGIGAYDILNEPNWDFDGPEEGHGCKSEKNAELWAFYAEIIAAIRSVDKRHMVVIEGNCWGNNYAGLDKAPDPNLVISFHKYWNVNDPASIAPALALRDRLNAPLWLGESGENSNTWFRDAIARVEGEGIGWAFWPLKKLRFNNPLEIRANPGWTRLVDYWLGKGPKPGRREAIAALMQLATQDVRFENNQQHPDVVDAMLRQPFTTATRPFRRLAVPKEGAAVAAVDYDIGRAGYAWSDTGDANYHVSTGKGRTLWNNGSTYRNDGVDIARADDGTPYVSDFVAGEWLAYTVDAATAGTRALSLALRTEKGGTVQLSVNGGATIELSVPGRRGWQSVAIPAVLLQGGNNRVVVRVTAGDFALSALQFGRAQP